MSCQPASSDCNCRDNTVRRREFLAATLAAGSLLLDRPVMAGPFEGNDYLKTIPSDKKLRPEWVRSLFERGIKDTYSDPTDLGRIGMPVGGLFAGTVYLSGDGRLWLWDIFNRDQEGIVPRQVEAPDGKTRLSTRDGANYVQPAAVHQPFELSFQLRCGDSSRELDSRGFSQVTFDGRYPLGQVSYRAKDCPIEVSLRAFSPFIPLNAADSSLPVTVLSYTLTNTGSAAANVEVVAKMANAICLESGAWLPGERRNRVVRDAGLTAIVFEAVPRAIAAVRPDIVFDDFERETYAPWTTEGDAFGEGPVSREQVPNYQGDLAGVGARVVNSHAAAPGSDVSQKDQRTGKLTSPPFVIERRFISLLVGGGAHPDQTCVRVIVDGRAVGSVTGRNENRMSRAVLNVASHQGKTARLEIVDTVSGSWGNVGVDQIVFTDVPPDARELAQRPDFGTMTLACLGPPQVAASPDGAKNAVTGRAPAPAATAGLEEVLIGTLTPSVTLEPGETSTLNFLIAWHFPNFYGRGVGGARVGHAYAERFDSAWDVARYVATNYDRLASQTRLWVETWYDSTLPYWLLDRTMANTSTLATTTCYRFADGRFWGWEGIGCCEGTCTHVWHYAQALGRLFPEVERDTRQRVDFGLALHPDGAIGHRASLRDSMHPADDGQCGRILGVCREHQMSADATFLRQIWPQVKRAIEFLIRKDGNRDGMIEDAQPNTLDAAWYGKVSFLASLYLAALRAGETLGREMGDETFARQCGEIVARGAKSILDCYNGEYFAQIEDPQHTDAIGVGAGCYIDQVFGQTWAHWLGLGRLFDQEKQLSALRSLWKYNFVPDAGVFREKFPRGRWYAMAGDAGLIMCSWPRGGQNPRFAGHWQAMYFNECMSGFEWQAAAHMIWEGLENPDLLEAGLAVSRAIHDRYRATLRNPYNEIECSDHYARAMASYGVFLAACGYYYHGPQGKLAFSPRIDPDQFRCPFTAAEGWGTYSQVRKGDAAQRAEINIRWGRLRLQSLGISSGPRVAQRVECRHGDQPIDAAIEQVEGQNWVRLREPVLIEPDSPLSITLHFL